jgi:hypothetical protein
MPYIKQEKRYDLTYPEAYKQPQDAGELNFVISDIISVYLGLSPKYENINEVIGVLECAKLELYRRIAAPYEDKKKEENGDVYTV